MGDQQLIDQSTPFGQRVQKRLQTDRIIWLTTIDSHNMPQPKPVWFLWDGETFLIFSSPKGYKLKHIARNPNVSLNLDGDGLGGDIVVFTGVAEMVTSDISAEHISAYNNKYVEGFKRIQMTPAQFANSFSTAIRVRPTKLRGH